MIKRIVLTGGPCGGKTSAIKLIREKYEKENYIVLSIDETATEIINSGITPYGNNAISMYDFQKYVFESQIKKEQEIEKYIKENKESNIIVLYDRCLIDNKSYVSDDEFNKLLNEFNININDYIKKFDLFIHMVSAAIGTNEYTLSNNNARVETEKEAKEKDKKILDCYKDIPKHVIVDNKTDFDDKVNKVIELIENIIRG